MLTSKIFKQSQYLVRFMQRGMAIGGDTSKLTEKEKGDELLFMKKRDGKYPLAI